MALVIAAFYLAGILLAANAVMTVRTAQGAIAWAVSLVSVPFVAVPAYLVFGRSKFEGAMQAYEQRRGEIDALIDRMRTNLQPWSVPEEASASAYRAVQKLSGATLVRGNRVELLVNGEATFDSILAGIASAERYVLVQFYMFHDHEGGNDRAGPRRPGRVHAVRRGGQQGSAAPVPGRVARRRREGQLIQADTGNREPFPTQLP